MSHGRYSTGAVCFRFLRGSTVAILLPVRKVVRMAMKNVFVFCAWNKRARANYRKTILNPIPEKSVLACFPAERHAELRAWREAAGGFFAWGFRGGQRSITMWRGLEAGDCVLGFFEEHYRAVARLVGKEQNGFFAQSMWGSVSGDTEGWKNILFLSKPCEVAVPAAALCPYLCSTYRGGTRIARKRIDRIVEDFGSLDAFIGRHFGGAL